MMMHRYMDWRAWYRDGETLDVDDIRGMLESPIATWIAEIERADDAGVRLSGSALDSADALRGLLREVEKEGKES